MLSESHRPFIIVMTKADKIKDVDIGKQLQLTADFIKTSTGFGPRGASFRDVEIFKENSSRLKIKAAGGVRDNEAAKKYIRMGVDRIGTSTGTVLLQPASPSSKPAGGY